MPELLTITLQKERGTRRARHVFRYAPGDERALLDLIGQRAQRGAPLAPDAFDEFDAALVAAEIRRRIAASALASMK